jgi:hypothetical protein
MPWGVKDIGSCLEFRIDVLNKCKQPVRFSKTEVNIQCCENQIVFFSKIKGF